MPFRGCAGSPPNTGCPNRTLLLLVQQGAAAAAAAAWPWPLLLRLGLAPGLEAPDIPFTTMSGRSKSIWRVGVREGAFEGCWKGRFLVIYSRQAYCLWFWTRLLDFEMGDSSSWAAKTQSSFPLLSHRSLSNGHADWLVSRLADRMWLSILHASVCDFASSMCMPPLHALRDPAEFGQTLVKGCDDPVPGCDVTRIDERPTQLPG
jgi:hypothetical protein